MSKTATEKPEAPQPAEFIRFKGALYCKAVIAPQHIPTLHTRTVRRPSAPPPATVVQKMETERLRHEFFAALDVLVKKLIGLAEDREQVAHPFIQLAEKHPRMIEPLVPGLEKAFRKLRDAGKQFYTLRQTLKKVMGYKGPVPQFAPALQSEPQALHASAEIQAAIAALNMAADCTDEEWAEIVREYRSV